MMAFHKVMLTLHVFDLEVLFELYLEGMYLMCNTEIRDHVFHSYSFSQSYLLAAMQIGSTT